MIVSKILGLVVVLVLYFFITFQHLTSIPVFGDEAIYLRWSQIIKSVETLRFIPLTDGKQPLFMWLTVPFFKLFSDPLVAGRALSVFSGSLSLIGIFLVTAVIFSRSQNSKIGKFLIESINQNYLQAIFSSLFYIFLPFIFFFNRLATADSLLATTGIWSLFLSLMLAKFPRFDLSLILGAVLGISWLTKSPAIYFIVLSFLTFIYYHPRPSVKILLPLISAILAFGIYNLLRLGPQFHQIALRNLDYVHPFSEILSHPLDPLLPHLRDIIHIYSFYLSWPVIIFLLVSIFIVKNPILLFWWLLPLIANAAFAKVFTGRYLLFTVFPLVIILGSGLGFLLTKTKNKFIFLLFPLLSLANFIYLFQLSVNPFKATLPRTDSGYLIDWTSGWGIKEASTYLKTQAANHNVIVGTEGSFGTLPNGLQIYTEGTSHLTVIGLGLEFYTIPESLQNAFNAGDDVYLLINQSRLKITPAELKRFDTVATFSKPDGDALLLLHLTKG